MDAEEAQILLVESRMTNADLLAASERARSLLFDGQLDSATNTEKSRL